MYTRMSILLGCIWPALVVAAAHAKPHSIEIYITAASSQNSANVEGNFSNAGGTIGTDGVWHYVASATTAASFNGNSGIAQESQNAGANSTLQNGISLAEISSCSTCLKDGAAGLSVIVGTASNTAHLSNNRDFPGYGWASSPTGGGTTGGGATGGNTPGSNGLIPQGSDPFATISDSFNHDIGIFSANQNGGNNSSLQSSTAVSAVNIDGSATDTSEISTTNNYGVSRNNSSYSFDTPTSSNIEDSGNDSIGSLIISQNSGSNSLLQNASTIAYLNLKSAASGALAMTVAKSGNAASLANNFASSQAQPNLSLASNSFDSSIGVLLSSQNAAANSIVQNAISVADVIKN